MNEQLRIRGKNAYGSHLEIWWSELDELIHVPSVPQDRYLRSLFL